MSPQVLFRPVIDRSRVGLRRFHLVALAAFSALCLAPVATAQQDFGSLMEKARADFKPVSAKQLAAGRADLLKQMKEIEQFVQPSSENGKRWMRYLKWDNLKAEVNDPNPQGVEAMQATLEKLNRNVSGMEHRRFRNLAKALRKYRTLFGTSLLKEQQPDFYGQQLAQLRSSLDEFRKAPRPATEMELSGILDLIDSIGQAPELVKSVQEEIAHPNAFVDITTSLIAAGIEPINRSEAITDCILGVNIHGDAHTTGSAGVASIPSDKKAVLEFNTRGFTQSQNVGFKSPAVIHSSADTNFTATKRVELTDAAFAGLPAAANATTDTHIHSVAKQGGGLGSRLVSRIGWSRAMQSEHQAEAIAADHAEDRVENRFNDEVNQQVGKLRKRYEEEYRRPLERRGEVPEHIRFSSDKSSLKVEVVQASSSQFGAPQGVSAPTAEKPFDMTLRLHESAVNNYSASILGGATARQPTEQDDLKFDVDLPKWMTRMWGNRKAEATNDEEAKKQPFKPYSMSLRDDRPLSVKFADDKVKLTLHVKQIMSGDHPYDDWDVTGTYVPEIKDGRVFLRREGKIEILPPGQVGDKIDDKERQAQHFSLEKEFEKRSAQGKGFPQTIEFDPVKPEGRLAKTGPLAYQQFTPRDGWLVIGLDRQSKHSELPAPKPGQSTSNPVRKLRVPN